MERERSMVDFAVLATSALFNSDKYSDITIKFGEREIKCHKVIICSKSTYFNILCGDGSRFAESKQNVVELKDDHPAAVEATLRYLYTGRYYELDDDRRYCWRFHFDVLKCADKYMLDTLSETACAMFTARMEELHAAASIWAVISAVREEMPDTNLLKLVDEMENENMRKLLSVQGFCKTMTPERLARYLDGRLLLPAETGVTEGRLYQCDNCRYNLAAAIKGELGDTMWLCRKDPWHGPMTAAVIWANFEELKGVREVWAEDEAAEASKRRC